MGEGRGRRLSSGSRRSIAALGVLLAAGLVGVFASGGRDAFSPQHIQAQVLALGSLGVVGFLVAAAIRPVGVILSGSLFSVAAGLVWGPIAGSAIALGGVLLSAGVVYGLSRALGTAAVRELAGARYERFSRLARAGGFPLVFVATLGFLLPTDLVIAVASAAGVRLRTVMAATAMGSVPGTVAMALMGASAVTPTPLMWGGGIAAVVILSALAALLARQWLRAMPQV